MKIFIAYGYNERDRWVKDFIFPLVTAFGSEVVDGEGLYGQILSVGVLSRVKSSDALIGFATRRSVAEGESHETHLWVVQELACGLGAGLRILEIRERDTSNQKGMMADRHWIDYDSAKPENCLLEVVKALAEWHSRPKPDFVLVRDTLYSETANRIDSRSFKCFYQLRYKNRIESWQQGNVVRERNQLHLLVPELEAGALIQVRIQTGEKNYFSDFEKVNEGYISLFDEIATGQSQESMAIEVQNFSLLRP